MKIVAAVQDPVQVSKILTHLGERSGSVPTRAWDPLPCADADLSAGLIDETDWSSLDIDVKAGKVAGVRFKLMPVFSDAIAPDPAMASLVTKIRAPFEKELARPVGKTETLLYRRGNFNGPGKVPLWRWGNNSRCCRSARGDL